MTLEELRRLRGLSRAQLAKMLGADASTIWYWERGKRKPRLENIRALAQGLGVPVDLVVRALLEVQNSSGDVEEV